MIAVTAYTEPVSVNTAVNEAPQSKESEENREPSAFARLLAGLLRKTAGGKAEGIQSDALPEGEADADVLAGEKSASGKKHNLLNVKQKGTANADEAGAPAGASSAVDNEHSEINVFEDQMSVLFGAQRLFSVTDDSFSSGEAADDFGAFLPETADVNEARLDVRLDAHPDADFSFDADVMTDGADADALARLAMQMSEEDFSASANKKDRASLKNENMEAPPVQNNRGEEAAFLRNAKPENESRGRLDEMRNRPRRDKVSLEVRDFRTADSGMANNVQARAVGAEIGTRVLDSSGREITLELRLPEGQSSPNSSQTAWETKAASALENMLARELHQNFNGDIVRHASMALRDGGEGTIRLALKPETLGNVKIHLEMADNKITGRIVVESEEALNAFRREISSLEQAFRDSGFESADLNLSMSADGSNAQEQERETSLYMARNAASRYDDILPDSAELDSLSLVDVYFGQRQGTVNMLA